MRQVDQRRSFPVLRYEIRQFRLGRLTLLQAIELDIGMLQRGELRQGNVSTVIDAPEFGLVSPESPRPNQADSQFRLLAQPLSPLQSPLRVDVEIRNARRN